VGRWLTFDKAVNERSSAGGRVEFTDEGIAVIDQVAIFDRQDAHAFAGQRLGDTVRPLTDIDGTVVVDLERPGAFRILPGGWIGLIGARAGLPATGWGLHLERLVRADVVVFAAEGIEPQLMICGGHTAAVERPFHAAVEPLHLALGLHPTDQDLSVGTPVCAWRMPEKCSAMP